MDADKSSVRAVKAIIALNPAVCAFFQFHPRSDSNITCGGYRLRACPMVDGGNILDANTSIENAREDVHVEMVG